MKGILKVLGWLPIIAGIISGIVMGILAGSFWLFLLYTVIGVVAGGITGALYLGLATVLDNQDSILYRLKELERNCLMSDTSSSNTPPAVASPIVTTPQQSIAPKVSALADKLSDGRWICRDCGTRNQPYSQYCRDCGKFHIN